MVEKSNSGGEALEEHVTPKGVALIRRSELFEDAGTTQKDQELIDTVLSKKRYDVTTKELKKLKEIARSNLPSSVRVPLWMLLSGGSDELETTTSVYQETCDRLFSDGKFEPDEIHVDQERAVTYYLNPEGIKKVQKVLVVTKDLRPDITYCPLLEPLVAIMLHFMTEAQCYTCVSAILSSKHSSFLEQTKFDNACTDMVLQELFKSFNKKHYSQIKSYVMIDGDTEEEHEMKRVLFPLWRSMIFERLDFVILVRIVDCVMAEGVKIFYRVALYLLNEFYYYSLTFKKMQFSDAQDLITTIGQRTQTLELTAAYFLKAVMRIKFTTSQLIKINVDIATVHKEVLQNYIQSESFDSFTKQVVAVDLNKVSDIIKPMLWLQICGWLPSRIQLKQPNLLFSTNRDGFNLKTLYQLCEDEEQTLFILRSSTDEVFGAYLSAALSERTAGHRNLTYFGTGETFLFKLSPMSICYFWNKDADLGGQHGERNKYVFVDRTVSQSGNKRFSRRRGSARKSIMQRLSRRKKTTSRSASVSHAESANASNGLSDGADSSKQGFQRHHSMPAKSPVSLQISDQSKFRSSQSDANEMAGIPEMEDTTFTARSPSESVGNDEILVESDDGNCSRKPPPSMFISCDNNTFIIGGGGGEGLYFDGEIQNGRSSRCETFQNDPLTSAQSGDFTIVRLDVFGFN